MSRTSELTDNEGGLIAIIRRKGPLSAYQIAKDYETSPVFTFNTAKGKLYPLLDRMAERGLLARHQVANDRRGTKLYACTEAGRVALKSWVQDFRAEHELPPDPLRRKLQALELLDISEQLAWVRDARTRLAQRLEAVEAYDGGHEGVFGRSAQDNARESLRGRLRWLDALEVEIDGAAR